MAYAVVFAPEAVEQLEALFLYIASQGSPLTAERYTDAIVATCERMGTFPDQGVTRDDIRPGLRITHHRGRAIIAFAVNEARRQVSIVGIFYGGQDHESTLAATKDS